MLKQYMSIYRMYNGILKGWEGYARYGFRTIYRGELYIYISG